jgi:hypothetical protein
MYYKLKNLLLFISFCVVFTSTSSFSQQKSASVDIGAMFEASGWMGDGQYREQYVRYTAADRSSPHSRPASIKVTYTFGPMHWAGMYWQNRPDNWGDFPGADYSRSGFSKITFWARGETGNEVVRFKAGGIPDPKIKKPYKDSFEVSIGATPLTREWRQYTIDLSQVDLKSVIGGFAWVANDKDNSGGSITFYLEEITLR